MSEGSSELRLSVVIPTCNRSSALHRCLAGLAGQSLPPTDFEVIVVDDSGRAGDTKSPFVFEGLPNLQLIRHSRNSGAAAARNTGARLATTPYLAFVDDDCVPESGWATELATLLPECNGLALVGSVKVAEPQPMADRVTQLLSEPLPAADGSLDRAQTANLIVRADDFRTVGEFDETFRGAGYEDYEFCHRWRASGRRLVAVPGAVVLHRRDTSPRSFWRQHFQYGRGAAHFYGGSDADPQLPWRAALKRFARTIGAGENLSERIGHLGWAGLSQVAMLTGFVAARISRS